MEPRGVYAGWRGSWWTSESRRPSRSASSAAHGAHCRRVGSFVLFVSSQQPRSYSTALPSRPRPLGHEALPFRLHPPDPQALPFWPLGTTTPTAETRVSKSLGSSLAERPDRVELVPLPAWQPVGENFTLSCRVPGAGPRGSLTITLLRGTQELIRRSFSGEPPRARGAVLTATVLARREDHGANFSCHAELDLRPHGLGLFENSSAPRMLRTFGEWVWGEGEVWKWRNLNSNPHANTHQLKAVFLSVSRGQQDKIVIVKHLVHTY